MGFVDSVRTCLSDYATFSGRAPLSEYWFMVLFSIIFQIAVSVICGFIGYLFGDINGMTAGAVIGSLVASLLLLLPMLAVTVRRLHDSGHSGWWYFISLVPMIGGIWLLILLLQGSTDENEYGPQVY